MPSTIYNGFARLLSQTFRQLWGVKQTTLQDALNTYNQYLSVHRQRNDEFVSILSDSMTISDAQLKPVPQVQPYTVSRIEIPQFRVSALTRLASYIQTNVTQPAHELDWQIHQYNTASQEVAHLNNRLMPDIARLRPAIMRLPTPILQQVPWLIAQTRNQSPNTSIFAILNRLYSQPDKQPTEHDICTISGAQIIPALPIIQFMQQHVVPSSNYRGHKFLAHLRSVAPALAPNDERQLNTILSIIHLHLDRTSQPLQHTTMPTAPYTELDATLITWPFRHITNQHVSSFSEKVFNRLVHAPGIQATWSFVPDRSLVNAGLAAEDALWFDVSDRNRFCAIIADGASQSAIGRISAQVISHNLYRLYAHTVGHMPTVDEIKHVFDTAKWDCHEPLDTDIQTIPSYMRSSIEQKRHTSGSQSVVSVVVRHDHQLLVAWVGNVRVIIPGIIDADSPLFASDGARFTSNHGLLGELSYRVFDISGPIRIVMHSDAVEHMKHTLVEHTLTAEQLDECAKSDDTTVIDIRMA